jgi:archaemetzincin
LKKMSASGKGRPEADRIARRSSRKKSAAQSGYPSRPVKRRLLIGVAGALSGVAVAVAFALLTARPSSPPKLHQPRAERLRGEALPGGLEALKALHQPKGAPGPNDWLAEQDEPGQTLKEYLRSDPVRVSGGLKTLYLVRVGDFGPEETKLLDLTREFLSLHFGVPVRELEPISAEAIPAVAQRQNPLQGQLQWHSEWMLEHLLPKLRPDDGVALMALTRVDLWPRPGWNFVFGEASVTDRVGVWSIARHGDPKTEWKLVLLRTLKVAAHEAGHMFSMHHCIAFECLMNGSNNLVESDQGPLAPCPVCLAKLHEATRADLKQRFAGVRAFLEREGLAEDAAFVARSEAALAQ